MLTTVLVAQLLPALVAAGKGFTGQPVIAGYWPAYASDLLPAANIQYSQFTHIDWFVATTTKGYTVSLSGSASDIKTVVSKAHAANVSVSMTIGGWDGGIYFSDLVANSTGRTMFAQSLKGYVDQYGFDGIDLDWEYPATQGIGCNTIRVNDSDNLLAFVQQLRTTLGPDARLSAAVSVYPFKGPDGNTATNIGQFANYLDYMTIMAYDIYGPYSSTTGPVGQLFDTCATSEAKISGATSVALWTAAGFPANKLLLGLPSYAYSYTTTSSTLTTRTNGTNTSQAYQAKTTAVPPGGVTSSGAGTDVCGNPSPATSMWLYKELISSGKLNAAGTAGTGGYTRVFDACSQTPFLFNNSTRNFIAYDDPQSYSVKAAFARGKGLAGINMFDLTGDTTNSVLIGAARAQLLGASFDAVPDPTGTVSSAQAVASGMAPANQSTRPKPPAVFRAIARILHRSAATRWRHVA